MNRKVGRQLTRVLCRQGESAYNALVRIMKSRDCGRSRATPIYAGDLGGVIGRLRAMLEIELVDSEEDPSLLVPKRLQHQLKGLSKNLSEATQT